MERFDCCSSYNECSDLLGCIHTEDADYLGCTYREKLEAGIVFYGKNAGKQVNNVASETDMSKRPSIFLYCFNRLFAIKARNKVGMSYNLSIEQAERIEAAFKKTMIPYRTEINSIDECIIDRSTEEDPAPANSRVVFTIDTEEYNLLNFNSYLIKYRFAELICRSFDNNYICSRVEISGSSSNKSFSQKRQHKKQEIKTIDTHIDEASNVQKTKPPLFSAPEKVKYTQVSIFDLMLRQSVETAEINEFNLDDEVLASEEHWGKYKGIYLGTQKTYIGPRAKIQIIENVETPSQEAIYFKVCKCRREPYKAGEIKLFDLDNVFPSHAVTV